MASARVERCPFPRPEFETARARRRHGFSWNHVRYGHSQAFAVDALGATYAYGGETSWGYGAVGKLSVRVFLHFLVDAKLVDEVFFKGSHMASPDRCPLLKAMVAFRVKFPAMTSEA